LDAALEPPVSGFASIRAIDRDRIPGSSHLRVASGFRERISMSTKRSIFFALAAILVLVVPPLVAAGILSRLEESRTWEIGFARLGLFAWVVTASVGLSGLLMLVSFAFGIREVRRNRLVLIWVIPQMLAIFAGLSAAIVAWIVIPLGDTFGFTDGGRLDGIVNFSSIALGAASLLAAGLWLWRLLASGTRPGEEG
jgi:hypothetical protein